MKKTNQVSKAKRDIITSNLCAMIAQNSIKSNKKANKRTKISISEAERKIGGFRSILEKHVKSHNELFGKTKNIKTEDLEFYLKDGKVCVFLIPNYSTDDLNNLAKIDKIENLYKKSHKNKNKRIKESCKIKNKRIKIPKKFSYEEFTEKGEKSSFLVPLDEKVNLYCDGVFDLFHYGHMRMLRQAKNLFPNVNLVVGVSGEQETIDKKGVTVMTESERVESVSHCRYVDSIVHPCPWVIDETFLEKQNLDYVVHDDAPYAGEEGDIYQPLRDRSQFIASQRTAGISTSSLIKNLLRQYDNFVRRNLKRGIKPEEMNISVFKANFLLFSERIDNLFKSPAVSVFIKKFKKVNKDFRKFRNQVNSVLKEDVDVLRSEVLENRDYWIRIGGLLKEKFKNVFEKKKL